MRQQRCDKPATVGKRIGFAEVSITELTSESEWEWLVTCAAPARGTHETLSDLPNKGTALERAHYHKRCTDNWCSVVND